MGWKPAAPQGPGSDRQTQDNSPHEETQIEADGAKRGPFCQRRRRVFSYPCAQIHISCATSAIGVLQTGLINKHRNRNLKAGCQRSHMVKGKITIAIEDTTDK